MKSSHLFKQINIKLFISICLVVFSASNLFGQQKLIDSLEISLKENQLTKYDRLKTMNLLAKYYIAEGKKEAYKLVNEALVLARDESDIELKLPAYLNKTMALEMQDSIQATFDMIDTCMQYTATLGDVSLKAQALLVVARIKHIYQDETDVLSMVFEALDIAKRIDAKPLQVTIYHFLANTYYGRLNNIEHTRKYAELAYKAAKDIPDGNEKALSFQSMGFMYRQAYIFGNRSKETELYLDSAIVFTQKSIKISDSMEGYIPLNTNLNSLGHLNSVYTYQTYVRNDSTFYIYPDSIFKYSNIMLNKAQKANSVYLVIAAYRFLSGYESNRKNFEKAEDILIEALDILAKNESGENNEKLLQTKYSLCLSLVYQLRITKKYEKALDYMEEAYTYQSDLFQKKYIRDGQISEIKYKVKEKEHALMLSQEEARRHKQLLIGSMISAVVLLAFLFVFYQMRLKNTRQALELNVKEKEKIRLNALLKEKELQQSESEKKTLALEKELEKEKAERQALEINRLQTELIAGISQLEQKSDTIEKIQRTIAENKQIDQSDIKKLLLSDKMADKSYENFSDLLQKTHPEFFTKLQEIADNKLTALDLKYCTYILMDFSSKEIANIMHVESKTARSTKYRLKLKLNLSKEDDLTCFIKSVARSDYD